ncbi:Pr6Pr family membrane protein [Nocardioides nanhaiensis]
MGRTSSARAWHGLTAVVATAALLLQVLLVVQGGRVLDEAEPPDLPVRLARLVAYFTVQSNLLVAVTAWTLVRDPHRDGPRWRVLRLASTAGIVVTGLVHLVLLAPLLDLDGADALADVLLHRAVPLLALAGWLVLGPRPRVTGGVALGVLAWPLAWLVVTLTVGATTGWYPYPFLDPRQDGVGAVVASCAAITLLVGVLLVVALVLDRRLPATGDRHPRRRAH